MRVFISGALAASVLGAASAPAFAMDPFNGQGWQKSRPPAAIAYFKMPFHAGKDGRALTYGLALTGPTPRMQGPLSLPLTHAPRLLDLRFNGFAPDSLRLSEQLAWSQDPSAVDAGEGHHLVGGALGWAINLALTGAAIYGIYTLLKKECPAISTTTGGCVGN